MPAHYMLMFMDEYLQRCNIYALLVSYNNQSRFM